MLTTQKEPILPTISAGADHTGQVLPAHDRLASRRKGRREGKDDLLIKREEEGKVQRRRRKRGRGSKWEACKCLGTRLEGKERMVC